MTDGREVASLTPAMVDRSPSLAAMILGMIAFLIVGGPIAYFMWHELSTLLYGRVDDVRFTVLIAAVAAFLVVLKLVAAFARRLAGPGSPA